MPGELELFFVGTDNHLLHLRQTGGAGTASWAPQPPFTGTSPGQTASAKQVEVGRGADGTLELFYVGTNDALYHNRQASPGGTVWSGQELFSRNGAKQITVVLDSIGKLELFYIASDNKVYHNRQDSAGSSSWEGQVPLAGISAKQIVAAVNTEGLIEVFYVGTNSGLYHISQNSTGSITDWGAPVPFAGDSAEQIAVAANQDGRLELFYVGTNSKLYHNWQTKAKDPTQWSGEVRFPGASAKQVALGLNQDGRLEIFYVGTNSGIYHNWQVVPNGDWIGEVNVPGVSASQLVVALDGAGSLEVCYVGTNTSLYHNWQLFPSAAWVNQNGVGKTLLPPPFGLTGPSNYQLTNCSFLTDVAITITVTQDIVCPSVTYPSTNGSAGATDPSNHGFSFQLNCLSVNGSNVVWQQYGVALSSTGKSIYGWVDNWINPLTFDELLINNPTFHLANMNGKIPAGYKLRIMLQNDSHGTITGLNCQVIDENGDDVARGSLALSDHGVQPADMAPITSLQLNFVGEYNNEEAGLSSGTGTIDYTASSPLQLMSGAPTCSVPLTSTGETANSSYTGMTSIASNVLSQTFGVLLTKRAVVPAGARIRGRRATGSPQ